MTKITINGFGEIGRSTFRRILDNHPASNKIIKEIEKCWGKICVNFENLC